MEAVKGTKTVNQIASDHGLHPNQIIQWKKQLLGELPVLFSDKRVRANKDQEALEESLYQQIRTPL